MTLAPAKLSADFLAALPAVFTGRKAASVLAGVLLYEAMPPDMREHLSALLQWACDRQVAAAALVLLGLSALGSATASRDAQSARPPTTTQPADTPSGRPPGGALSTLKRHRNETEKE